MRTGSTSSVRSTKRARAAAAGHRRRGRAGQAHPSLPASLHSRDGLRRSFSQRTRDAQSAAREHAARGGRDWDAMPEEARVAFLKGGAKASRQGKGDDLADADAWRAQAEALGWSHRSAVRAGPPSPALPDVERVAAAREVAGELLGRDLEKRAVLVSGDVRAAAARGLISTGAASVERRAGGDAGDGARTASSRTAGGRHSSGGEAGRRMGVPASPRRCTATKEKSWCASRAPLAPIAAARCRRGNWPRRHSAAASRCPMNRRPQRAALGEGGRLAVAVGADRCRQDDPPAAFGRSLDVGKTRGLGRALAWRQAGALEEAGIGRGRLRALQPLLDGLADGSVAPGRNAVVVMDELGQVGPGSCSTCCASGAGWLQGRCGRR